MEKAPSQPDGICLNDLEKGMQGIEPARGTSFAHAAVVCLEEGSHLSGVPMLVDGDFHSEFRVFWRKINDQIRRSWADFQDATEKGAYGVAALLIVRLTENTVVERARKGKGFDYWLGPRNGGAELFQNAARLEVSGILRGDAGDIRQRLKAKLAQIKPDRRFASFVVVVEFGKPTARMVKV